MTITLAVDAMGGDHGCSVTVPACLHFLEKNPQAHLILVGQLDVINQVLERLEFKQFSDRLVLHPASQFVAMDEDPRSALKNKKDSSMRVALNLVKEGRAHAFVSAGNTGALVATSKFVLKTVHGIDRPAIARMLPTMVGYTCVLDLGANVDCTPEQLRQFGVMGSVLVSAVSGLAAPKVGLLNVGSEEIKGCEQVKQAALLLKQTDLNFIGNVEGDGLYLGHADVLVCDGFVGNIALKTSEGLARLLSSFIQQEFTRSWHSKLLGLFALPVLKRFKKRTDPRRYNGASLLGLNGVVVKSHGGADVLGFEYALTRALDEARSDVVAKLQQKMSATAG